MVNMQDYCRVIPSRVQWCQKAGQNVVKPVQWWCPWSPVVVTSTWLVWSPRRRTAGLWTRRGLCALLRDKRSTSTSWTSRRRRARHQTSNTMCHESARFEVIFFLFFTYLAVDVIKTIAWAQLTYASFCNILTSVSLTLFVCYLIRFLNWCCIHNRLVSYILALSEQSSSFIDRFS